MESQLIKIRGARQHNLKNIDLDIPKNKFVVLTGVSGSGKSSLAFDTIYAEGQRRYVESLSTYSRQFLGIMDKPDVDFIEGLSPAISIDQKTTSHNPRSTVGTVTEIYDYLRLLFARIGHPHCPICGREISALSIDQISESIISKINKDSREDSVNRYLILAPLIKDKKGEFSSLLDNLKAKGFTKVRIDHEIRFLSEDIFLLKNNKHTIDVVIDNFAINKSDLKENIFREKLVRRIKENLEIALKIADGLVILSEIKDKGFQMPDRPKELLDHLYSEKYSCPFDNLSLPEIEPRNFSFNSPHGACPKCLGIGKILNVEESLVFSPDLTISEGAILPFSSQFNHDTWFSRLVLQVCIDNQINIKEKFKNLSLDYQKLIFEGTGSKEYKVEGTNRYGEKTYIIESYPGVKGELSRRLKQSDSEYLRYEIQKYMREIICSECNGLRLKKEALMITIDHKSISDVANLSISEALNWSNDLSKGNLLSLREKAISNPILKEISGRLSFLLSVGLNYLTLARGASTLAGGEAQRIRLASQIGSGLTGVLYVLDEPTVGLHPRDDEKLIGTLKKLRDLGNSVIVVEHDREMMNSCDYLIDFGPGAGKFGGKVIAQGSPSQVIKNPNSITAQYLSGKKKISLPSQSKLLPTTYDLLTIRGCAENNLKNIDVSFPLGKLIAITGVSGSGKSTLLVDTLFHALSLKINPYHKEIPGKHSKLEGYEKIDKVILIDQSPIGKTPRSNPATYTKVFDLVRDVFAQVRESKINGFKKGRFSFNLPGGRCESCEGQGQKRIEMQFMSDIWVKCEVCNGKRYNSQTLEVTVNGKTISDVLDLTVTEAKDFFHLYPQIVTKLETLIDVGLNYIELGQSATTLSGGESQRVKLASELSKKDSGKTFYILDEPTTGLHFEDLFKLLKVLKILTTKGNTVAVIEHNLDIVKNSDWIIDLGPEGGDEGGMIIAQGKPKDITNNANSYTGKFLKKEL